MNGRRVDPTGKLALFEAGAGAAPDRLWPEVRHEGRTALFSTPPRRPGTVLIECSRCKVRTRASFFDLGLRLALVSAWFPFGRYQHWIRCSACGRRQWCRVGWTE